MFRSSTLLIIALVVVGGSATLFESSASSKFAGLKEGGIAKQASFVGLLLFSLRSVTDLVQISGPNGESHLVAAGIQGVIALACGVYLLLF